MNKSTIILAACLMAVFFLPQAGTRQPLHNSRGAFADTSGLSLDELFRHPPEQAKPWVFWYWMQAAVSKEGITADLEAMQAAGIGGAYMMFIKGTPDSALISPSAEQLSPYWWQLVKFAMQEAKRLNLQLAMHVSDGFALAGGPWITPELSMQKIVWTKTYTTGKTTFNGTLPQPETREHYYKDIAVLAFPTMIKKAIADTALTPVVSCSVPGEHVQFLAGKQSKGTFKSDTTCWIQYSYGRPFTCRSIVIRTSGTNYEARRLQLQVSDDGQHFTVVEQMQSPRHGWQDGDAANTYAIPATTSRYFRFVYNKEGSEPGSEDLDAAKWKPSFKINGIELSGEPVIHQYEGKSGAVWRVSTRTTAAQAPDSVCVPLNSIIDITSKMTPDGHLNWEVPAGNYTIVRIGHTSTGSTNATGGGGKGLECDKFNADAVRLQFDKWFGEAIRQAGPDLAKEVLKIFHVDSWECGSQNWSPVFQSEFKKRRGYDCMPYIITMTGIPVQSADISERFLHDVRQTIVDLVKDSFFVTLKSLAHEKGCTFTAESVAPTMTSDGLLHYSESDIPMGEFWLRSPTHDKPNDMADAISGAHIYGKPIVQAEAFTELRLLWDEYPGMLKTLGDRNYALGINRLVYHVFMHNPWMDRKPGMTLGGVGLFFQRDQTWFKQGKAWVEYAQRCQALLQQGTPVTDVAVFTGEDIPRRSILPDRLVSTLPGIFGDSVVQHEKKRLDNTGTPLREQPVGVVHSANMADPENWIDPLHGYAYDCLNPDVLLKATVRNGRIELPGGASYRLLVLPGAHPMSPTNKYMTPAIARKIAELVKAGANIIINEIPDKSWSLQPGNASDAAVKAASAAIWNGSIKNKLPMWKAGNGTVFRGPYGYGLSSFKIFGIERDLEATDALGNRAPGIAWTHRHGNGFDIYFISNQRNEQRTVNLALRVKGYWPELWNPVNGDQLKAKTFQVKDGKTLLPVELAPNGSLFIVLKQPTTATNITGGTNRIETRTAMQLNEPWQVQFDSTLRGPSQPVVFEQLKDWSTDASKGIRFYSGTAGYTSTFVWPNAVDKAHRVWLDLGNVANIASVSVNGIPCGIAWTAPYRVDITKALRAGKNELHIDVTNTWFNRLKGDASLPEKERITWMSAHFYGVEKPLLPAGLLGPVTVLVEN